MIEVNKGMNIGSVNDDDRGRELLIAVAEQLKRPLLHIAHGVELARLQEDGLPINSIDLAVSRGLRLIESYLLSARSDHGQTELRLEPVSISSVIYDVAQDLAIMAKEFDCQLDVEIGGRFGPVMSNREALKAGLLAVGEAFLSASSQQRSTKRIILSTYKSQGMIKTGMFGDFEGLAEDIARFREFGKKPRVPIATFGDGSSAGVMIADVLFSAMNSPLLYSKYNKKQGLAVKLLPSQQMNLALI